MARYGQYSSPDLDKIGQFVTVVMAAMEFILSRIFHDSNGNRRLWLSEEFHTQFDERSKCLIQMYNGSRVPGLDFKVNGLFTLDENIADNEGVKLAFKH
ncbi:hypothetical protein ANCDUO_02481 [Ancylostoma duodenale]|uniref:Peptidase M13 C-terminal domain-containing protein n=1 Tax=Ancylostoma duodenale TaxID=51022 RepID=A0A0C2HCC2_9BILA|nr:hypothetical protein ANCDUO_02481 [Ancylostoma duodenale]